MRILLIQPRHDERVSSLGTLEPLGLEVLGAALPDHEVRIFDCRLEDDLTRELREWQPDLIGVTARTVEYPGAVSAIREAREFSGKIPIVVGGIHATLAPHDFNLAGVKAIVLGLGHKTIREVVEAIACGGDLSRVRGLALPCGERLLFTEERLPESDFAEVPKPDRSLTAGYRSRYRPAFSPTPTGVAITSLGCPARCSFCSSWKVNKGRYLELDARAVVEDILSVPEREVLLADDNSLHNVGRAWEIVRLLREAKIRKRIRTYARADTIAGNPGLIRALKEVGLVALVVGYEAASDSRLKRYNKGTSLATNRAAIEVLRETGVQNRAMFVVAQDFGPEDFEELFRFVESEGILMPKFTVCTPMPGTPFHAREKDNLLTGEHAFFDFTHCVLPTRMDYMRFFERYAGLYRRSYSLRRYARLWWREFRAYLKLGAWPRTDRQNIPFVVYALSGGVVRRYARRLRRDYEQIASAAASRVGVRRKVPEVDPGSIGGGRVVRAPLERRAGAVGAGAVRQQEGTPW